MIEARGAKLPSELWADLVDVSTAERLRGGGFARRSGFGQRLAIVVVDVQNYMLGPFGSEDFEYPSSCGVPGRAAAAAIANLLPAARAAAAPVFYTRFELAADGSDMGAYQRKRSLVASDGWCLEGTFGAQIADVVAPQPGDIVMVKKKPSAFMGTPLLGMLIDRAIDTVVVTGGSTSNCVRATAVDAASFNFRVAVPADCVFDRVDVSHRVALFDLDRQYGDVIWSGDVAARFSR